MLSVRNAAMVGVLAIASAFTLTAWAHGGEGMGGRHGGMGMFGGHMVERMLDRVNATPDQRAQIKVIADAAAADLKGQRDAGRALREQGLKAFAAPNVDANAVEAVRQQQMAGFDRSSRRVSQAMLEVSRVLTPEQRKQLADDMTQRGEMMKRHHQERQQGDGVRKS